MRKIIHPSVLGHFEPPSSGRIILDCDEVLLNWQRGFRTFLLLSDKLNLDPGPPNFYGISKWLGVSKERGNAWMREFIEVEGNGFDRLDPVEGAVEAVHAMRARGYSLVVLTSCSDNPRTIERRRQNLIAVFGDVFEEIRGVPLGASKLPELMRHEPSMFIDDHPGHIASGEVAGHTSVLMRASTNLSEYEGRLGHAPCAYDWQELLSRCPFLAPEDRYSLVGA